MKTLILLISMFFAFAQPASAQPVYDDETAPAVAQEEGYSLILLSVGESKLITVKAIKETLEIELKTAKEIVDAAPNSTIIKGLSKEDAQKYLDALKEAGVDVALKAPGEQASKK